MSPATRPKPATSFHLLPTLHNQVWMGITSVALILAGLYALTQPSATAMAALTACEKGDCDLDGLPNDLDWDDDNDGIADLIEGRCQTDTYSLSFQTLAGSADPVADINAARLQLGAAVLHFLPLSTTANAQVDGFEISAEALSGSFGIKVGVRASSGISEHVSIHFRLSESVYGLAFDLLDIDQVDALQVNAFRAGVAHTLITREFSTGACVSYNGNNTFASVCNNDLDGADGSLHLQFGEPVDEVEILLFQSAGSDGGFIALSGMAAVCADRDTDQDGIPDYQDQDSDNDGLSDSIESICGSPPQDYDHDGQADYIDADSDNDGIYDEVEAGGSGGFLDSDRDGIPNHLDLDSDNDGIPDRVESSGPQLDADGDGLANYLDLDSDNDGIPDLVECGGIDRDGNGMIDERMADSSYLAGADFDQDGIPNYLDLDADNDGISDAIETWSSTVDIDQDGRVDEQNANDLDHNGWHDAYLAQIPTRPDSSLTEYASNHLPDYLTGSGQADFDGDGLPNYLDIDSDNDGIVDLIEAQASSVDTLDIFAKLRRHSGTDADFDGLSQAFDMNESGFYLIPVNTDQADEADFLDLDTDNDGVPDLQEGHDADQDGVVDLVPLGTDSDQDGLDDVYDADLTSKNPTASRPAIQDTDGDLHSGGDRDWRDLDSSSFPDKWLSFTAVLKGEDALLRWTPASETGGDFFEIERSADSRTFAKLHQLSTVGDGSTPGDYTYTDSAVLADGGASRLYYRLRQNGQDGSFAYSPVIELALMDIDKLFAIDAYPNPAQDEISFRYLQGKPRDLEIAVFNTQGQLIWRRRLHQAPGKGEVSVNVSHWATGVYLLRVSGEAASSDLRWVKQ